MSELSLPDNIDVGLILGSGIPFENEMDVEEEFSLDEFDIGVDEDSSIEGHDDTIAIGTVGGVSVCVLYGRLHIYEGYDASTVAMPVRIFDEMGVENIIITNAAGATNPTFSPGEIMFISDHLNMLGDNPLCGYTGTVPYGSQDDERFVDLSNPYSKELIERGREFAESVGLPHQTGVYMANIGPSYETPAEVNMAQEMGADAVGMSTVPEVIVANQLEMDVLGITCLTNMAAGISETPLSHQEVIETTEELNDELSSLLELLVKSFA